MEDRIFRTIPVERCWKHLEYVSFLVLMIMPVKNPVFKVALALHIGLQTIVYVFYSIIVHFKSFNSAEADRERGVVIKLLNYIPTFMSNVADFILNAISKMFQLLTKGKLKPNFKLYTQVITFALISFRKQVSLASWGYITEEDDNSMHLRTLILFCIFNLIQYRFVIQKNSSFTKTSQKLGWLEGLKKVFIDDSKMPPSFQCSLLKLRRTLFFGLSLLATLTCIILLYNGFLENDLNDYDASTFIVKLLLFIDVQFSLTMCRELHGLEFSFNDCNHSKV